jgi:hypothetical protein
MPKTLIHTLHARWNGRTWVYDDIALGVIGEPFVAGADHIITALCGMRATRARVGGAELIFSAEPFPAAARLDLLAETPDGYTWYYWAERKMKSGFCPHFHDYFKTAPRALYARVDVGALR